jgi:hypothetical protein
MIGPDLTPARLDKAESVGPILTRTRTSMPFEDDIRERLEGEESETVGTAFGGTAPTIHNS